VNDAMPFTGLTLSGVAHKLGVPRLHVWWRAKAADFPNPRTRLANGTDLWSAEEVETWALTHGRGRRVPLTRWPSSTPAEYAGTRDLTGAIAQCWHHPAGTIALVWRLTEQYHPGNAQHLKELPGVSAVVFVDNGFDIYGYPDLSGTLPTHRPAEPPNRLDTDDQGRYDVPWPTLATVIGMPVPYWPYALRHAELIQAWSPGDPAVTAPAAPFLDTAALRELADTYPTDHPAAQVLTTLARHVAHQAMQDALSDLNCLGSAGSPGTPPALRIAARPLTVPEADLDALTSTTRRAGWLEVLARTDTLAAACVRQARQFNSGQDFPYSNPTQVTIDSTDASRKWADRLRPVAPPLPAGFQFLSAPGAGPALIDPLTDAPARQCDDGTLLVAIPQRLPATSPLAEVILDHPVWVRTQDGALWPLPQDSRAGISWGYSGSGPGTLAQTLARLLDDINAPGAHADPDQKALRRLTELPLPQGTVITRAELEAIRAGKPIPARLRMLAHGGDPYLTIQDVPPTRNPQQLQDPDQAQDETETPDDDQPTGGTR